MELEDGHEACFEAGIKFGSLYHQFVGTPVSPASAESLERAIEASIENQPYCISVDATIEVEKEDMTRGYTELSGRHLTVELAVRREGVRVDAAMAMEEGYPLMRVVAISEVSQTG